MSHLATFTLKGPAHAIESAGLHDAVLHSVSLNWKTSDVDILVSLQGKIQATLKFHNVSAAVLSREQPWGPSDSINEAKEVALGRYEIEMQSGDLLNFTAASWSLSIIASPGVV